MDRAEMLRQMISEYRSRVERYTAMIAEWEKELVTTGAVPVEPHSANGVGTKKDTVVSDPLSKIRAYQFFSKSQPEAAKMLLEFAGHPLLTQQIVDGLEKGGVTVGGKTPKDKKMNLYSILTRSDEFVRWKKDTWGLPSWPGAPKKAGDAEEEEDTEKAGEP
jgi:hypothetical protein